MRHMLLNTNKYYLPYKKLPYKICKMIFGFVQAEETIFIIDVSCVLGYPYNTAIFVYKSWRPTGFCQLFEIIRNALVSSSLF